MGTPNYTGARGAFTSAYSGVNAWATGLTTPYAMNPSKLDSHLVLRTPIIDLTGVPGAELKFFDLMDIEPVRAASLRPGIVNVLDSGGAVLGTNVYTTEGTSTDWIQRSVNLNEFTNQQIIIEFELVDDGFGVGTDEWYGWALDDIPVVEGPRGTPAAAAAVHQLGDDPGAGGQFGDE